MKYVLMLVILACPMQSLETAISNAKEESKKLHVDYDIVVKTQDSLSLDAQTAERRLNDADMAGKASQAMRDALEAIDTYRSEAFNEMQNANQNLVDADYWIGVAENPGADDDPWECLRWSWTCMEVADDALGRADTALVGMSEKLAELDQLLKAEGF